MYIIMNRRHFDSLDIAAKQAIFLVETNLENASHDPLLAFSLSRPA
jgi:hypothetical protein